MMTLDDAIVAFGQLTSDDFDSLELDVRDYERLVNWLTELKLVRESAFSDIWLAARAVSENNQLKAENAKLRDELAKWERLAAGIHLPEYPLTQFKPKDLERENAKLRELADAVKEFVEDTHCEDCPFRRDCDDNNRIFCADDFSYHAFAAMRELGIEVTNG